MAAEVQVSAAISKGIVDSVRHVQGYALEALTSWTGLLTMMVPGVAPLALAGGQPQLMKPDLIKGLDQMFKTAEEILSAQREFANHLAEALVPA